MARDLGRADGWCSDPVWNSLCHDLAEEDHDRLGPGKQQQGLGYVWGTPLRTLQQLLKAPVSPTLWGLLECGTRTREKIRHDIGVTQIGTFHFNCYSSITLFI